MDNNQTEQQNVTINDLKLGVYHLSSQIQTLRDIANQLATRREQYINTIQDAELNAQQQQMLGEADELTEGEQQDEAE